MTNAKPKAPVAKTEPVEPEVQETMDEKLVKAGIVIVDEAEGTTEVVAPKEQIQDAASAYEPGHPEYSPEPVEPKAKKPKKSETEKYYKALGLDASRISNPTYDEEAGTLTAFYHHLDARGNHAYAFGVGWDGVNVTVPAKTAPPVVESDVETS